MKSINLTASEVSAALGIKYGTLTAWRRDDVDRIEQGKAPLGPPWEPRQIGRLEYVVYPAAALRAWVLSEKAASVKLAGERIGAIDALAEKKRGKQ